MQCEQNQHLLIVPCRSHHGIPIGQAMHPTLELFWILQAVYEEVTKPSALESESESIQVIGTGSCTVELVSC